MIPSSVCFNCAILFIFNWWKIALQFCVGFRCITTRISHTYIYMCLYIYIYICLHMYIYLHPFPPSLPSPSLISPL